MAEKDKKQESVLIKIYIIILFLCGIGIWLAVQPAVKNRTALDVEIDKKVVDVLNAGGVKQEDIISQYAKEMNTRNGQWSEFYKKIRLRGKIRSGDFENQFRSLARLLKVGLSRTDNPDGSVTYKFYSSGREYSNITFINPQKTEAGAKKAEV